MLRTGALLRFTPALFWAVGVFLASSRSELPGVVMLFSGQDKLLHAAEFGGLAGWLLFGDGFPTGRRAWFWVGMVALYGLSDELHQWFVPGRSADAADWLADVLGAGGCAIILTVFRQRWQRRSGAPARLAD